MKHGYFSAVLTPDEERRAAHIKRGDLTDLIVLEYTLLHRAVVAMMRAEEDPEAALVLDAREVGDLVRREGEAGPGDAGDGHGDGRTRRLPDWHARIGRHVRRIKDLEAAQRAIRGTSQTPEEIGAAIRRTLGAAVEVLGPGLPGGGELRGFGPGPAVLGGDDEEGDGAPAGAGDGGGGADEDGRR